MTDIKELTQDEVYAIMQSDIQLWERATTTADGNSITKRLILPFGIGEVAVEFQGVDSGVKRRAAAEQWGAIVRDRVKERIDDESITQRARIAAATGDDEEQPESVGQADSGHSDSDTSSERLRDKSAVPEESAEGSVQAHAEHVEEDQGPSGTDFAARAEWLRTRIGNYEARIKEWRRELRALDAALAVLGEDE